MRVSVFLSTAMAMAIGASSASAMDANEIFNRLKAQAGAAGTVTTEAGSVQRGLAVSYGEPEETAAAPAPSVVAVPAAPKQPAAAPSTYVSTVAPAVTTERAPEPSYTLQSPAPAYTTVQPSVPTVTATAPAYQTETPSFQPAPEHAQIPSYTPVETPKAIPVAARPSAASYSSVEDSQRVDLRIFFEWNSASLKPEAIGQLAELCTAIRRVGASADNRFKIIGHTDKSGTYEYNLYLSNARAREVKRHLVEECALPASALLAVGEGERQSSPSAPANAPEERRVEIQLVS